MLSADVMKRLYSDEQFKEVPLRYASIVVGCVEKALKEETDNVVELQHKSGTDNEYPYVD